MWDYNLTYSFSRETEMNKFFVLFYDLSGKFLFKTTMVNDISKMPKYKQHFYLERWFEDILSKYKK